MSWQSDPVSQEISRDDFETIGRWMTETSSRHARLELELNVMLLKVE